MKKFEPVLWRSHLFQKEAYQELYVYQMLSGDFDESTPPVSTMIEALESNMRVMFIQLLELVSDESFELRSFDKLVEAAIDNMAKKAGKEEFKRNTHVEERLEMPIQEQMKQIASLVTGKRDSLLKKEAE
ncbi:hypothetical protein [Vibrio sp. WXL210]|uniref:hypothetical protein n=1 Tax=Vibrio sp. WXL210 TaxID=3450709 RepID=UPI003EC4D385